MKILGIIGGTGPESTIAYYRLLITSYQTATQDGSYPHLVINSVDNKKLLDWMARGEFQEVIIYLVEEVKRLAAAGADFGLLSANTSHIVFDEVQQQSPIPLLSIVEVTCDEAKKRGIRKAGLLGTRFTMQGRFYPQVFNRDSIQLVVPTLEEQVYVHDIYLGELVHGVFLPETRTRLLSIVERMQGEDGIEAMILGGTELPLILREEIHAGISMLNTAKIHVEAAVQEMMR